MVNRSEFLKAFLISYQFLTRAQKKILKCLQWFAKKFNVVFVGRDTLANATKCHKATISRCTKLFESWGWLCKKQRGYCSNLYFLHDEIISLNLDDPFLFLREECDMDASVLRSSSSDSIDLSTLEDKVPAQKAKNERQIPQCIKISGLKPDEQQRLANKFSEYQLVEAVKDAKWYVGMKNVIDSMIGFLWSRAKNY